MEDYIVEFQKNNRHYRLVYEASEPYCLTLVCPTKEFKKSDFEGVEAVIAKITGGRQRNEIEGCGCGHTLDCIDLSRKLKKGDIDKFVEQYERNFGRVKTEIN